MDLKSLFYKHDEYTGELRLSKTNVITSLVFLAIFIYVMNFYLTDSQYAHMNILILLIAGFIVGLIFAIPVYLVGLVICKIIYPNKSRQRVQDTTVTDFNPPCPHDYAVRFKNAIELNDSSTAEELLKGWDKSDANYQYAYIIYEGMPPTHLSRNELNELLNQADKMTACDESLKPWYRSTAIQVITLND